MNLRLAAAALFAAAIVRAAANALVAAPRPRGAAVRVRVPRQLVVAVAARAGPLVAAVCVVAAVAIRAAFRIRQSGAIPAALATFRPWKMRALRAAPRGRAAPRARRPFFRAEFTSAPCSEHTGPMGA